MACKDGKCGPPEHLKRRFPNGRPTIKPQPPKPKTQKSKIELILDKRVEKCLLYDNYITILISQL